MSKLGVIEQTPDRRCELCGKVAELRPYGPKSENVCFDCGMKDEKACERGFERLIGGAGNA